MDTPYSSSQPLFAAQGVQIGKGLKPLAQNGQVRIEGGNLILIDSKGAVIDAAPVQTVTAKAIWYTMKNGASATVNGTKYFLGFNQGGGMQLALPADKVFAGRSGTKKFLRALASAQGNG